MSLWDAYVCLSEHISSHGQKQPEGLCAKIRLEGQHCSVEGMDACGSI